MEIKDRMPVSIAVCSEVKTPKKNYGVLACGKLQWHVWLQAFRKKGLPSSDVYSYPEYEHLHCPLGRKLARYLTPEDHKQNNIQPQ
jgi:hypothetical protein